MKLIYNIFSWATRRIVSRWMILALDIIIAFVSYLLAYLVRFNFDVADIDWNHIWRNGLIVITITAACFLIFKSYVSILRHTSLNDAVKVFQALTSAVAVVILFELVNNYYGGFDDFRLPISIILIYYLNAVFLLVFMRIIIKMMFHNVLRRQSNAIVTLIFGGGELGLVTKNTLQISGPSNNNLIGFIDEHPSKVGKTIEGIQVFHPKTITKDFVTKKEVKEIIIAIQNIDPKRKKEVIDRFVKLGVVVKIVPPVENWIHGELNLKQIKRVKIEDLLQREPIRLDNPKVKEFVTDRTVMVTGAAGSIGSEIVRQLMMFQPDKLLCVDQAETPQFELKMQLSKLANPGNTQIEFIIADISNIVRIESIFNMYHPNIIFHAAAYKHVPMMEENPFEAIRVNVMGTKNMADMAAKYKADCMVMISTDKAVRSTNVMGASKRFAEMYCQSLGNNPSIDTRFITTRFGNVLGSNGSVVKIFRDQIEAGGPITVTHPEITRYFMTIPEACNLVLEAATMSEGSEIFIFDMGQPVKIAEMAQKMIRLAGLKPEEDIKIEYSGLRPGEKLYEELLNSGENTVKTYHPKILIAQVDLANHGEILLSIQKLAEANEEGDGFKVVSILKNMIPDYISNNSVFQSLDKKKEEVDA